MQRQYPLTLKYHLFHDVLPNQRRHVVRSESFQASPPSSSKEKIIFDGHAETRFQSVWKNDVVSDCHCPRGDVDHGMPPSSRHKNHFALLLNHFDQSDFLFSFQEGWILLCPPVPCTFRSKCLIKLYAPTLQLIEIDVGIDMCECFTNNRGSGNGRWKQDPPLHAMQEPVPSGGVGWIFVRVRTTSLRANEKDSIGRAWTQEIRNHQAAGLKQ